MPIPASPSSVSKCRRHRRTTGEPCRCFPRHYRLSLSISYGHATPSLWPGWGQKSGVSIVFIGGRAHLTASTPRQIVASTQNPALQTRESSVSISRSWTHVGRSQQQVIGELEPGMLYVFDVYLMRRWGLPIKYHSKTVKTRSECWVDISESYSQWRRTQWRDHYATGKPL